MPARRISRSLAIAALVVAVAPAYVQAAVPAFPISGASYAIDAGGNLSLDQAQHLPYQPVSAYESPGYETAGRPVIVWLRVPPQAAWNAAPWYFEGPPDLGLATLYYVPPGGSTYETATFGMRVPYRDRSVQRLPPTLRIPATSLGTPMYLRLSIDEETRVLPTLRVLNQATLAQDDRQIADLGTVALVFIGIFLSLAAANLFVFVYIREPAYAWYSGMMAMNALFAATYLHNAAWKWIWPGASLPELPVIATEAMLMGVFMLVFAREFLRSRRIVPRFDRFVTIGCVVLLALAVLFSFLLPSVSLPGGLIGRDAFLIATIAFSLLVLALGVAVMLRGDRLARFFVAADLAVFLATAALAATNFVRHDIGSAGAFLALMIGLGVQGWLLFGALAYRFRTVAREYADEQQRRIDAQQEALAQAHALLEERRAAHTDALTGIANRRTFDETLAGEWERCARARAPLSLLIADVDFFKVFNDTYGHVLGDDCLRRVASAFAASATRPGDAACRYGGEEFGVILPGTDAPGAYTIAGEICRRVRDLEIPHRGSSLGKVTVSIGLASVIPESGTQPSIVTIADTNLYRAKESGRNRVASSEAIDQFAPRVDRIAAPPLRGIH